MKAIFATVSLLLLLVGAAEARSVQIATIPVLAKQLGGVLTKPSTTRVKKAPTARELFENYYMKIMGVKEIDEDFNFREEAQDVEMTDGSGMGTFTTKDAHDFLDAVLENLLNTDEDGNEKTSAELKAQSRQVGELLKLLNKTGAIFGFNENGAGVCGVSYTTFFVIDPATGIFYEFSFVSGPC